MKVYPGNSHWLIFSFLLLFIVTPLYSQQEVIIQFDTTSRVQIQKSLANSFGNSWRVIDQTPFARLTLKKDQSLKQFLNSSLISGYISAGQILDIEANYSYQMSLVPNDTDFANQWGLDNTGQFGGTAGNDIQADLAWDIQTKGKGILGLVDTGVDFAHPDLAENIWQNLAEDADGDGRVLEEINGVWQLDPGDLDGIDADGNGYVDDLVGWDFVNNDNNPFDDNGHGTHVAGIAAARGNNAKGISGVAWETEVMVLKAFDAYGTGQLSHILPALAYARNMGVYLTNNSWGSVHKSRFLQHEIQRAQESGQLFVAAAGNNGRNNALMPIYPASYEMSNIISVAATEYFDKLAGFSSYSSTRTALAAPGQKIYSTLPGNRYGYKSGTSMAAPFVAGAALLLHAYRPNLTIQDIRETLINQADRKAPLFGKSESNGRLNIFNALQSLSGSATQLQASFKGPRISCIHTPFVLTSTSQLPFPNQTSYSWKLDGNVIGNSRNLSYSLDEVGFYEFQLTLTDPRGSSSFTGLLEIKPKAYASLGKDTVLCSNAYVLYAGTEQGTIRWKKITCQDANYCDPAGIDSVKLQVSGIDMTGMEDSYLLTDMDNKILEIHDEPAFLPQVSSGPFQVFGVYYEIGKTPQQMVQGKYVYELDFGSDPCASVSSPYVVDMNQGILLGESPFLKVKESGTYVLEIEDACGNIASDTINLKMTKGCVWPGDVNSDGIVSMLDFLMLGIANQETGPSRPNAHPGWVGQLAPDWAEGFDTQNPLAPGINYKHADCNGDGIIDLEADAQVLVNNLGFIHNLEGLPLGEGPSFKLEHVNTRFSAGGDTAAIEVALYLSGPDDTDIQNFYGMAFGLSFSSPIVQAPDIVSSSDWLGPMEGLSLFGDGSQDAFGSQFLPVDRKSVSMGFVSANRRSSRGRGLAGGGIIIVTVEDIVEDSLQNGLSNFSISSENMMIIDSTGKPLSTHVGKSLDMLNIELNWEEGEVELDPSARWLDFTVQKVENQAVLDWGTAGEINTQKFIIERSIDGKLFQSLGEVSASGYSNLPKFYTYVDFQLPLYDKLYYRIKEVNIEGEISYSKVQVLTSENPNSLRFEAYPSPFEEELSISYSPNLEHMKNLYAVRIINALGQSFWEKDTFPGQNPYTIDTHSWPSGIYFVSFESEGEQQIFKLFKR